MNALKKVEQTRTSSDFAKFLHDKATWVRQQTLEIHKLAPETRVASSLSPVEIFSALYYGEVASYKPSIPFWEGRDRVVISKGHGSLSMYPILADLGFFEMSELKKVCTKGSFLGGIPDPIIPGYETVNGSLGHGVGVGCGMATALKTLGKNNKVFVITGDGELHEGSIWEGLMFASHHQLDNLNLIVDHNKKCMLGETKNILGLGPLIDKFKAFGLLVEVVDGHDVMACQAALLKMKNLNTGKPKALIAETVKGKGAPQLESNPMCHVTGLKAVEVDEILKRNS